MNRAAAITALERPDDTPRARAIHDVIDLMASGKWERGKSGAEVAARHGLAVGTVEHDAPVVSRTLERIFGDRERLEHAIRGRVDAIAQRFEHDDEPDRASVALTALRDIARNAGIGATKAGDVNVQVNIGAASEDEFYRRMVRVLERPDRVTLRALEAAGWRRDVVDTNGEEVSE